VGGEEGSGGFNSGGGRPGREDRRWLGDGGNGVAVGVLCEGEGRRGGFASKDVTPGL